MRSLRTTIVAGATAVAALVAAALAGSAWLRARSEAHAATRGELELAARTLGGLLEVSPGGHEFEMPSRVLPEYEEGGAFLLIVDGAGKPVVRSPSLAGADLAPAGEWTDGAFAHAELAGPGGRPCASVTWSFVAAAEGPDAAHPEWTPPPPEARRYRAVVAKDVSQRDERLRGLAWFLAGAAAAGVAAAAAGSFAVASWVLRPVRSMTDEAASLGPEDPSRRLAPDAVVLELSSLAATLNSALARLEQALDRERRFTADASHELRTPLAVLKSGADLLLRRERTPQEYREGLERQRRVIAEMIAISENLLHVAKLDAAAAEPAARADLAEVAASCRDEFLPVAAERGVDLACEADGPVPAAVARGEAAQIVRNLVSNAVRFAPDGGQVRVRARSDGPSAVLEVSDTGPGIPPAERTRVFERFHRVASGEDRREGAGLGLAIVSAVARARGGTAEALESPGGGALLRVTLPGAAPGR